MARAVVHSDPEILGGTPVFVGTRVPVKNLFDCPEAGDSLDKFLRSFPSVTREQAVALNGVVWIEERRGSHTSRSVARCRGDRKPESRISAKSQYTANRCCRSSSGEQSN